MPEMQLLPTATALYGDKLGGASHTELVAILSAAGLEMECRYLSSYPPNEAMETIHELMMVSSVEDVLTLAIAAAIKLRLPHLQAVDLLMPAALTIAA